MAAAPLAGIQLPEPVCLVIFGATGDLASRKLLPALFGLCQAGALPDTYAVVGVGRRAKDDAGFRADARKAVSGAGQGGQQILEEFLGHFHYQRADLTSAD